MEPEEKPNGKRAKTAKGTGTIRWAELPRGEIMGGGGTALAKKGWAEIIVVGKNIVRPLYVR